VVQMYDKSLPADSLDRRDLEAFITQCVRHVSYVLRAQFLQKDEVCIVPVRDLAGGVQRHFCIWLGTAEC